MIYSTFLSDPIPFTVNLAAIEVNAPIVFPCTMQQPGGGLRSFQPNDNIMLRRVRVWLPFYFVLSTAPSGLVFPWYQDDGVGGFNVVGLIGTYYVPQGCEWQEINQDSAFPTFVVVPPASANTVLGVQDAPGSGINISMVGVPAALDTLIFNAHVMMSVEHTLPLVF